MRAFLLVLALAGAAFVPVSGIAASPPQAAARTSAPPPDEKGVRWVVSNDVADVEGALAQARADNKPVFLYWGAVWCPPCNLVKSTIFKRADFIARSRAFVPVYLDGDTSGAQKLGARFRVSGYPTMILFRPDGSEITRLAGEVDPKKYMQLLDWGLAGKGADARQSLAAALDGRKLSPEQWRLLAYYAWETDEQQLVPRADVPATLEKLAAACPPDQKQAAARLRLRALALAGAARKDNATAGDLASAEAHVRRVLADPIAAREHYDVLSNYADDLVGFVTTPGAKQRAELRRIYTAALDRLSADATLSTDARLTAVVAKVHLAKLDAADRNRPQLADALLKDVRAHAARADQLTKDLNERQTVIATAGYLLAQAGLLDESDRLLRAELKRSHSPYYHMLGLASNARKRGTPEGNATAIDWARQAYEASQGPATRLQWGGSYVRYLVELAPADAARIESVTSAVVGEFAAAPNAGDLFFARNRGVLNRMSTQLAKWNKDGAHDAVLTKLRSQVSPMCGRLPAGDADRGACDSLFTANQRG